MHTSKSSLFEKSTRWFWLAAGGGAVLTGGVLLVVLGLPYGWARPLADHLARDGTLEIFSPELHQKLRWLSLAGVALLAAGFRMFARREAGSAALEGALRRLREDAAALWRALLRDQKQTWWMLGGITLVALALRLAILDKPLTHDEAYTVVVFASRQFRVAVTDYHLPNNHVLHTILVYLALHLLGDAPWMVRLPALAGGLLLIPGTYLAGRTLFDRESGLLAAGFAAVLPVLVNFSTEARGYTLLCLFSVLVVGLGDFLRKRDNLAGWVLLSLLGALGLYTIPIMVYPLGLVFTWLFLAWAFGDTHATPRGNFIRRWLFAGLGTGLLTTLLYLPIILVSGLSSLVGNRFVAPLSWHDFMGNLFVRLFHAWQDWNKPLPPAATLLWLAGIAAALMFHRRMTRQRVPLPAAALVWLSLTLLYQRIAPLSRFWVWLAPLLLIYAAAGLLFVLGILLRRARPQVRWEQWLVLAGLLVVGIWGLRTADEAFRAYRASPIGDIEGITLYLQERIAPDEVVVVGGDAPVFWYYFQEYGIPASHIFGIKNKPFRWAWVAVNTHKNETLSGVLRKRGNFADVLDLERAEFVFLLRRYAVYRVPHR